MWLSSNAVCTMRSLSQHCQAPREARKDKAQHKRKLLPGPASLRNQTQDVQSYVVSPRAINSSYRILS